MLGFVGCFLMKPIRKWQGDFDALPPCQRVQRVEGRGAHPTLKVDNIYLHSRYNPTEEAERLVASAELSVDRPVLVVGLGLGYHIAELLRLNFEVVVIEPDPAVAKLALDESIGEAEVLLAVGDVDEVVADESFKALAQRIPQLLIHPPTARIHPRYAEEVAVQLSRAALAGQHLNIAVVGPLYGGSLPITEYLTDAFRKLGHNTLMVDNRSAWDLYQAVHGGVQTEHAASQLTEMLTNFLSEWTYARVAEFDPEICIVMAQAPVGRDFPERLAKKGITTAYWFVENWRHMTYWREIAPHYDAFFHIQPGDFEQALDAVGCPHPAIVQTGCDPDVHKRVTLEDNERKTYECDLSFAGAGYYNRRRFFKGLTDYDFKIWGVDWGERDLVRLVVDPDQRFDSSVFMKVVAGSKINFNLHSSTTQQGVDPRCDAINPRVFEIAAAGGFQFCDPCVGLDSLFDFETEVPVYHDIEECRKKLDYFLAHPEERDAIARRAQTRALQEHTYEHRAQEMLDHIIACHGAGILRKGVRVQLSVSEVAKRVGEDTELGRWLATLPDDLPFTHDILKEVSVGGRGELSYPEMIFAYMTEVREFAEMMLKAKR